MSLITRSSRASKLYSSRGCESAVKETLRPVSLFASDQSKRRTHQQERVATDAKGDSWSHKREHNASQGDVGGRSRCCVSRCKLMCGRTPDQLRRSWRRDTHSCSSCSSSVHHVCSLTPVFALKIRNRKCCACDHVKGPVKQATHTGE